METRGVAHPNDYLCSRFRFILFLLEHPRNFLDWRQLRNRGEGAKEPLAPFGQVFYKI